METEVKRIKTFLKNPKIMRTCKMLRNGSAIATVVFFLASFFDIFGVPIIALIAIPVFSLVMSLAYEFLPETIAAVKLRLQNVVESTNINDEDVAQLNEVVDIATNQIGQSTGRRTIIACEITNEPNEPIDNRYVDAHGNVYVLQ